MEFPDRPRQVLDTSWLGPKSTTQSPLLAHLPLEGDAQGSHLPAFALCLSQISLKGTSSGNSSSTSLIARELTRICDPVKSKRAGLPGSLQLSHFTQSNSGDEEAQASSTGLQPCLPACFHLQRLTSTWQGIGVDGWCWGPHWPPKKCPPPSTSEGAENSLTPHLARLGEACCPSTAGLLADGGRASSSYGSFYQEQEKKSAPCHMFNDLIIRKAPHFKFLSVVVFCCFFFYLFSRQC